MNIWGYVKENKMTTFGISITIAYFIFVVVFRWSSLHDLKTMKLNEFGDFFAGVFGPLMLFWLILGYIQQQKELRQNTKALEMQADELRKSVEQHKELVEVTRLQAETESKALDAKLQKEIKEASPAFYITRAGRTSVTSGIEHYEIRIKNNGKPATNVKFIISPEIKDLRHSEVAYFAPDSENNIMWDTSSQQTPERLNLIIKCQDENMKPYKRKFELVLDGYQYRVDSPEGI
ncbi:hypothetical protein [Thiolapillus sp.]